MAKIDKVKWDELVNHILNLGTTVKSDELIANEQCIPYDERSFLLSEINKKLQNPNFPLTFSNHIIALNINSIKTFPQLVSIYMRNLDIFVDHDPNPTKPTAYVRYHNTKEKLEQIEALGNNLIRTIQKTLNGKSKLSSKITYLESISAILKEVDRPDELILEHASLNIRALYRKIDKKVEYFQSQYQIIDTSEDETPTVELKNEVNEKPTHEKQHLDNGLLNTKQAAEYLSMAISTLNKKPEIPFTKPAGIRYYDKKDLDEYLSQNRSKTPKELDEEANTFLLNRNFKKKKK